MNVSNRMHEVLDDLRYHFDEKVGMDTFHDLKPECLDSWTENYAIVYGLYLCGDMESEYFDEDSFRYDYEKYVKSLFPECTIRVYWQSQEIEVENVKVL